MHINFIKLNTSAIAPARNNSTDAGSDLYSVTDTIVPPLTRKLISTGIALEMPEGVYGRIAPRSGLALKHGIDVLAGVIDPGYRGEIGVILYNTDSKNPFTVCKGDRVAQIIFETFHLFEFQETYKLENTSRSDSGFGSSGR